MEDASQINDSGMFELTGRIMLGAIISLFCVIACVFLIHLFTKWFYRRQPASDTRRGDNQEVAVRIALRRGLDPTVLKTLPEIVFSPKDFEEGLECSVCLCEVSEGEKLRLLPKCNHGFHLDCIDTWFQTNSTCPLCRNPIPNPKPVESVMDIVPGSASAVVEAPNFPTNVLYWGDDTQVSTLVPLEEPRREIDSSHVPCSSSTPSKVGDVLVSNRAKGMLVIDVPRQIVEDDQESPMVTRFRSLRRLLSREMRLGPCSPSVNVDLEQGGTSQC